MSEMKEELKDEHVENVSGGIPGQLITHVVSTAINAVLGADSSDNGSNAGAHPNKSESETLKAKKDSFRLLKF